ncbi:MAG: hypothetical protein IH588_01265 [Anaerolineales bacterium]|nr:hypothetical protein [Anaerolineales bacterium]
MTDPIDEPQTPSVNADHNSNAVGNISAGGDISGNIHIGNVYQTPEDDLPLSSDEIENGLTRFAQYLPERAPVLQDSFSSIAKKLRATLGADQNSLSPALKTQREDGVNRMKLMCMEVTDISFRAICLRQNPPPYDSRPPFLGLFAFRPEDREFFFGRDALVQKLVARIKAHPFLAVLGASGSGKSSLVMAGLVPALEAQMSYLTPSSAPLSQLLIAKESASAKTVFVIDQFEELFTHPHDATERADFIHALLELTKTNRVVITMRADFWGEVAIYADLKQAMQEHQELIAPMTVDELHSAMEKQAAVVGLRFDPTLSETILAEVKGEPGAMPLLQHALWELWNRRHGLWIKAEEYQAFGGVRQAIASTAEEVYASCSDFERARVRDIFLRLTRLDESGEGRDTRRRVLIEELIPANSDSSVIIKLLNKLADARLIVKTDKDVEVAHEALIRHWSRLINWLNEDRDNLRLREGVSESAREWENSKRDDSLLNHRGGRLELALAMSKLPRYQLNPIEQEYLNASVALRNKEQRERKRRLRYTVIASIVAAAIFLVLGSFGWVKSNEATAQAGTAQANANAAATAQVNAETQKIEAEKQSQISLARQLAAQAQPLFANGNPKQETAVLLAIQSMHLFPAGEAAQILQNNTLAKSIARMTHDGFLPSVAFSPDGKYVVSGGCDQLDSNYNCIQGSAHVWESSTGKEIARMTNNGYVSSLAFSPDGKYVVSGGCDQLDSNYNCIQGSARVWETTTGKEFARVAYDGNVESVAFSPDGKYVVSKTGDITVRVWEVTTGKEISHMVHDNYVFSAAFSPDGKYVTSRSTDGTVRVWETSTGKEIAHMRHDDFLPAFSFSPDSQYVVSGGCDLLNALKYCIQGSARVWETGTGKEIARMTYEGAVDSVTFSPDGKYVVSGGCDQQDFNYICIQGSARTWEANTGKEIARMTHEGDVSSVAFSPDGKYVVSGSADKTARVWEASTGIEVSRMTYEGAVNFVAYDPDGKYVLSGGCDQLDFNYICAKGSARVWETAMGEEIAHMTQNAAVTSIAFSGDSKYVVSGSDDSTARVGEAVTGKEISRIVHDNYVFSVAFSPDSKYVVSGGCDQLTQSCTQGSARVWAAATGKEIARMTYDGAVNSVTFSPDGTYIVSGSTDKTARVWEASTGKEIARMTHDSVVSSVAFSPDGNYVVSASRDNTARVWETSTGKEIARMTHENSVTVVAFSPDSKYVVSGGCEQLPQSCTQGSARIWEAETGKEIARMTHEGDVSSVAFSLDGKYVVSGSADKTARVWEASTGKEIARMTHDGDVSSVVFSPDGKYVVSGSSGDITIRVWIYRPEDLIAEACSRVTRNLTRAEWNQYIGDALPYQAVCPNLPIESESTPVP